MISPLLYATFGSANGLSVQFDLTTSRVIYQVSQAPKSALNLVAQLASLFGTVVVAFKVRPPA